MSWAKEVGPPSHLKIYLATLENVENTLKIWVKIDFWTEQHSSTLPVLQPESTYDARCNITSQFVEVEIFMRCYLIFFVQMENIEWLDRVNYSLQLLTNIVAFRIE